MMPLASDRHCSTFVWMTLVLMIIGMYASVTGTAAIATNLPAHAPSIADGYVPPIPDIPPAYPRSSNDTFEYHFVAFRFVNASASQQQAITDLYHSLITKCPYIIDMKGGVPNSREGFQQEMDQAWLTIFRSIEDRDYFVGRTITYPYDPFHDEFKAFVGPYLRQPIDTGLIVIDFANIPFTGFNFTVGNPPRASTEADAPVPSVPSQRTSALHDLQLKRYQQFKSRGLLSLDPTPLAPIPTDPAVWQPVPPRSTNDTLVYHFVAFRFQNNTTPEIIGNITALYHSLFSNCPYMVSMVGGTPNSREGFQQQMDQAWVTAFRSVADRDYFVGRTITYPYDPFHDAFKAFVGPYLLQPIATGLIVIDWENVNVQPYQAPFVEASWNWIDFNWADAATANAYYSSATYRNVLLSGIKSWVDPRTNLSIDFVSLPRLKANVPATLGYLNRTALSVGNPALAPDGPSTGPLIQPFPSWALNDPSDPSNIASVLGFEIDSPRNRLYILDQGRIGSSAQPNSIKLILWDLLENVEIQRFVFDETICPLGTSFLNDIVVDAATGFAYISETGPPTNGNFSQFDPSLIVYDANRNTAWRTLERHVSTMPNASFSFQIAGTQIYPGAPMMAGIDGIALTPDGRWLFFNPLSSLSLYRLPTCLLRASDPSQANSIDAITLAKQVVHVMFKRGNADGLAFAAGSASTSNTTVIVPDPSALTGFDHWCSSDDLSSFPSYQLLATDLANSAVWSIIGDLAHATDSPSTDPLAVNPDSLVITAVQTSQPGGATEWPDAIGFNHLGSIYFSSNRGQHFNGLADMKFNETNFRLWSVYLGVDSYILPGEPTADDSDRSHSRWVWYLVAAVIILFGVLAFVCYCNKRRGSVDQTSRPRKTADSINDQTEFQQLDG